MGRDFDIGFFDKELNNIKCLYLENLRYQKIFWQYAEYNFLYRVLRENWEIYDHNYRLKLYFNEAIQTRLKYDNARNLIKLKGKILLFDVHSSMFDCLGEKETNGFIDGCDTPPPEFWIHFDGRNLYSFIPNELIDVVNRAIDISMSESLEWYTDLIEI